MLHRTLRIPVDVPLEDVSDATIAAEIFAPEPDQLALPAVLFACVPGGGMNRHYFDLMLGDDSSMSFARQVAAHGSIVVTLDPLGIGDSTRPEDGFALSPELLAAVNAQALAWIVDQLRRGTLFEGWPELAELAVIGTAHSVGCLMTIVQQNAFSSFDGLALLGFSTRGLPQVLTHEEKTYAGRGEAARAALDRLARTRFTDPYPQVTGTQQGRELFGKAKVDRRAVEALAPARDRLLPQIATLVLIPGSLAADCAAVDVPVFLGLGDLDFCGPTHEIPASFPKSPDVTLLVLPQMGHSHFIFPSTRILFRRLHDWARPVLSARAPNLGAS